MDLYNFSLLTDDNEEQDKTSNEKSSKNIPISPTEKIVREEIEKFQRSIEELKKITEEIKKKNK